MTYKILRNGADLGSATREDLRQRLAAGELRGDDLVSSEEHREWRRLDEMLAEPAVLPHPPMLGVTTARRQKTRTLTLLAALGCIVLGALGNWALKRGAASPPPPPNSEELAARPIPLFNTPTLKDVENRRRAWLQRLWLEEYRERGVHGAVPDAATEKFITVHIDRQTEGPEASSPLSLEDESDRLEHDPGCNDPLVLAMVATDARNWYDRVSLLKRAQSLFPASRHLAFGALYTNVRLLAESKYNTDELGELNLATLALLEKCFQDGSFRPEDQQEIASAFIDTWGAQFFAMNDGAVCSIVARAGPSYRWLALLFDGERNIVDAWDARGNGYSNTVTDEQWEEYRRLLKVGAGRLTEAWTLHPDFPLAPSLMVYDSLGTGISDMRLWFDRAVTAQIDYPGAWKNLRWGLRPRWYGSHKALMALGLAALNTKRFDTNVPREFYDCMMDVESELPADAGHRIFGSPEIWPNLQRMYEGYIAEPTQASYRTEWRNSYAAVSYLSHHYDVARKQLEALNWKLSASTITGWGADLSSMPLEVAGRTGPLGADVGAAEDARASGDRATALRLFAQLDSKHSPDAMTAEFIRFRLSRLTNEQHLSEGKWVSLMPAKDNDPDWNYSFGQAKRNEDGSLDVEYGAKGHMMFPRVAVGANFEVRGSFEVMRSSNTNFQGGIVMGLPDFENLNWFGFRVKRHDVEGDLVAFGLGWSYREMTVPMSLNDRSNSFDLILKDGRVTASVDGALVFDKAETPSTIDYPDKDYFVGLGAFSDSADAVVRYHDVQIRRLGPADEPTLSTPILSRPSSPVAEEAQAAPSAPMTLSAKIEADKAQVAKATESIKLIVNRPALSVPLRSGMNVTWWSDTWFHPGALVPDYAKVDITKTQEFPYAKFEYVASKLHPNTAFLARDLEFNPMTKHFYTDWTVPKKRLTAAEMKEVNRLYRVIAASEEDLKRLEAD